jgi:hypothetical protein
MNDPSEELLARYAERFDRDHDQRRSELLASLPDLYTDDQASSRPRSKVARPGRSRLWRLGAAAAIVLLGVGILLWTQSGHAAVTFGDVLRQVREYFSVRYKSTLGLGDASPRTSEIVANKSGYERKTTPDGQLQISDFRRGDILYVEPQVKWTLLLQGAVGAQDNRDPLERLRNLPNEAGRFLREEELAGRTVSVFQVKLAEEHEQMTVWADSTTGLPVRVEVVTKPQDRGGGRHVPGATLALSDFAWNEPVDDSLFDMKLRKEYKQYSIRLIDNSRAVEEHDLVEALRILAELSGGVFPESLRKKDLDPIVAKLRQPLAARLDVGSGNVLLAGPSEAVRAGEDPPLVRWMLANQKLMQLSRGTKFINQLTAKKVRWKYLGKGVRRGEHMPVFQYWPDPSPATSRIILGDLSVEPHLSKARQDEPAKPKAEVRSPARPQ